MSEESTTVIVNITVDPCAVFGEAPPTISVVLDYLDVASYILLPVCCICTFAVLCIFISEVIYLNKHYGHIDSRRRKTLAVFLVYPIFSVTSLTALFVPRSLQIAELLSLSYLPFALYSFLLLVPDYYGGIDKMISALKGCKLSRHPANIVFFACMKPIVFSESTFVKIKILVLQFGFFRPLLTFVIAVLWANGSYNLADPDGNLVVSILNILIFLSIFTSWYTMLTFMGIATPNLPKFSLRGKYLSVSFVILLTFVMTIAMLILTNVDAIACSPPYSIPVRADRITHTMYVLMVLPISILARVSYLQKIEYDFADDEENPKAELKELEFKEENERKEELGQVNVAYHLDRDATEQAQNGLRNVTHASENDSAEHINM